MTHEDHRNPQVHSNKVSSIRSPALGYNSLQICMDKVWTGNNHTIVSLTVGGQEINQNKVENVLLNIDS